MIRRFSSRRQRLDQAFLAATLRNAKSYDRSAGYFRSSIFELVGEEIAAIPKVRIVCNSELDAALLDDGPVLILCPSTLTFQWQVELKDRLGIPSAVWSSNKKVWMDPHGHTIKTRGAEDIARCPFRIAIVSTGLITQPSEERRLLLLRKYGTVILDEAHKARRSGGLDEDSEKPNNLLDFMMRVGQRTRHLLLGTATPIQTEVHELWDLMRILNSGADFVMGRENLSLWQDLQRALPVVKGDENPIEEREAWEWLRNPLPPGDEEDPALLAAPLESLTPEEARHLRTIVEELSRPEAHDPKLGAVRYLLTAHRTEGKTWLEHGCIIFSQYYDTAHWIASELAMTLPGEPVAFTPAPAGVGCSVPENSHPSSGTRSNTRGSGAISASWWPPTPRAKDSTWRNSRSRGSRWVAAPVRGAVQTGRKGANPRKPCPSRCSITSRSFFC